MQPQRAQELVGQQALAAVAVVAVADVAAVAARVVELARQQAEARVQERRRRRPQQQLPEQLPQQVAARAVADAAVVAAVAARVAEQQQRALAEEPVQRRQVVRERPLQLVVPQQQVPGPGARAVAAVELVAAAVPVVVAGAEPRPTTG